MRFPVRTATKMSDFAIPLENISSMEMDRISDRAHRRALQLRQNAASEVHVVERPSLHHAVWLSAALTPWTVGGAAPRA
jgi:hypothetical protein